MRIARFLSLLLLPLLLIVAACGDDGPKGPGGSDEDYLRLICKGTQDFSNAVVTKTTADGIAEVIHDWIDLMKGANPPADLREYNDDFVQWLEDAVADPTSLLTRKPPLPDDDVQRRLVSKELTVDECEGGSFFSRTAAQ